MANRVVFARQALAIAGTAGRLVLPPVLILPQTSAIEMRIARPTTLSPLAWGDADVFETRIILEVDGLEEHVCIGRTAGGIRFGADGQELPEYVLRFSPTYGFFGERGGLPIRLGERARNFYRARIEIVSLTGRIGSTILVTAEDAPAPAVAFRSSVAFDAATSAVEIGGDGVISASHTSSGANRGVFSGGGNARMGGGSLSTSTTYGGTGTNEQWDAVFGATSGHAGYTLHNQATGAQTVTNTLAAAPGAHVMGVTSMTGVHQTTPVGTAASATGTANPSTVTVGDAATGDLVCGNLYVALAGAPGIGADQTQRYAQDSIGGGDSYLKGDTQPGSAGGVVSWSNDGTGEWGIGAIAFKPSPQNRFQKIVGHRFALVGPGGLAS